MHLESFLKAAQRAVTKHAPEILTIAASVGVVITAVCSAKATSKANLLIEKENSESMSTGEVAKVVWKAYIPTAISATATIGCMIGANVLNRRSQATLASAYMLLDNTYRSYRRKLIGLYGEDAHNKIVEEIAVEQAEKTNIYGSYLLTTCDMSSDDFSEPVLFYEEQSRRYFEAPIEQVLQAEYYLNRNYALRGAATLNEFYEFLGLAPTDDGDIKGWIQSDEGTMWIDFNHRRTELDDGLSCYILEMPFEPILDFDEDY